MLSWHDERQDPRLSAKPTESALETLVSGGHLRVVGVGGILPSINGMVCNLVQPKQSRHSCV